MRARLLHEMPSPPKSIVMLPSAIQIICKFVAHFAAPKAFLIYVGSATSLQSVISRSRGYFENPWSASLAWCGNTCVPEQPQLRGCRLAPSNGN